MALNTKVSLLICLGFIGGMSWLVSGVAHPIDEAPPLLIVQALPPQRDLARVADGAGAEVRGDSIGRVADWFARPSPLVAELEHSREPTDALVLGPSPIRLAQADREQLPPLTVPQERPVGEVVLASSEQPSRTPVLEVGDAALGNPEEQQSWKPAGVTLIAKAPGPGVDTAVASGDVRDVSEPPAESTRYRVRRGDSLTKIARRVWKSKNPKYVQALIDANPKLRKRPNKILVGEELVIPGQPGGPLVASAAPQPQQPRKATGLLVARTNPKKSPTAPPRKYTIRQGDSLAGIARRFFNDHRRWREIAELNRLPNANRIVPGMRIKLPPIGIDT